jgi:MFS transporter, DHA3 family, macrolide efflux protein
MRDGKQPKGMTTFTIVWVGQAFSLLSTSMTNFALTIWAFEVTGSATALALVGFFYVTPLLIVSPIAGVLVDRSNRKLMMMLSDIASGVSTLGILILYLTGNLQVWHLYVAALISGTFQTFQWPAYSAALTLIVPKQHYARAHALTELAGNTSGIFAPLLAGALFGLIGLTGILVIDLVSLLIAIGALVIVYIPQPRVTSEGLRGKGSIWRESGYGFRYILERRSLLGLQLVFLLGNFFSTISFTLLPPMVLARTMNNSLIFGSVETAGAIGGVVGGLIMGVWGGPKRRVHGVLMGWVLFSLLGPVIIGLGRSLPLWALGSFLGAFFSPLINSSNQSIWQSKVAPDVQGRVFATRRLIAWLVNPLATLIAGPAADFVMEPAMLQGGALAEPLGWLVGTGAGSGMALIIIFTGFAAALVGIGGYFIHTIRNVEEILPDHRLDEEEGSLTTAEESVVDK